MKLQCGQSVRSILLVSAVATVAGLASGCATGSHAAARPVKIPTFTTTTPFTTVRPPSTALPNDCEDMLDLDDAQRIVNHPMPGIVKTLVDVPNPLQNRTARVNCTYGVPPDSSYGTPGPLEIGASDYTDPVVAQQRAKFTADDAQSSGAQVSYLDIGPDHAIVLTRPQGKELVVSRGKATVTVNLAPGLVPDDKVNAAFTQLIQVIMPWVPQ